MIQAIKANELRIDNWVNLRVKDQSYFGKVDSIHRDHIYIGGGIKADLKFIYPIPLTPELLEKAGFKKEHNEYALAIPDTEFVLRCEDFNIGVILHYTYLDTWGDAIQLNPKIKHLHQLQNLYFAITGQELAITL